MSLPIPRASRLGWKMRDQLHVVHSSVKGSGLNGIGSVQADRRRCNRGGWSRQFMSQCIGHAAWPRRSGRSTCLNRNFDSPALCRFKDRTCRTQRPWPYTFSQQAHVDKHRRGATYSVAPRWKICSIRKPVCRRAQSRLATLRPARLSSPIERHHAATPLPD